MDIATAFRTATQHRQTSRRALKDESCRRNARLPYPTASRQKQNPDPARTMRSPLATRRLTVSQREHTRRTDATHADLEFLFV